MRIEVSLLLLITVGCAAAQSDPVDTRTSDVIFFVPGVAGASQSREREFIDGLHDGGIATPVQIVEWGSQNLFDNFSDVRTHQSAELALWSRIDIWRKYHPSAKIDIIADSAGCGVALGALRRLEQDAHVNQVVLLSPSVSPQYDVRPSLAHVAGTIHVFYSGGDDLILSWRTGHFGTDDGEYAPVAGNRGFELFADKLAQHPYQPQWKELKNDGGHFGAISRAFAAKVIAPLIR